jgi:hypothetical protein
MNVHHVRRLVKGADGTNTINIYNTFAVHQDLTAEDPAKLRAHFEEKEEPSRVHSMMHAAAETSRLAAAPSQPLPPPHLAFDATAHDVPARTIARSTAADHRAQLRSRFDAEKSHESEPGRVLAQADVNDVQGTLKIKLGTECEPPDFSARIDGVIAESELAAVPPSPAPPVSFKSASDAHSETARMAVADGAVDHESTVHGDASASEQQATLIYVQPATAAEGRVTVKAGELRRPSSP